MSALIIEINTVYLSPTSMETLAYRFEHSPEQTTDVDTSDTPVPDPKGGHVFNLENSCTCTHAPAPAPNPNKYFSKPASSLGFDDWLEFSKLFSVDSEFDRACNYVDKHLASNGMFLLHTNWTLADCRLCTALYSTGEKWENVLAWNKYNHLIFFAKSIKLAQSRAAISHFRRPRALPNAKNGAVSLRLSLKPFPCLGLQYARLAILLEYYAKKYQGRLIIHFDDIDPNMSIESEARLLEDLQTLGINCDTVRHTSDYISQMLEKAETLICQGKAYVDYTSQENIQKEVMDDIKTKCRAHSIEENIKLWKEMIAGSDVGRKCCLRGKLDMRSRIKYLRDPVYYHCNSVVSYRTGAKLNLCPTLVFSCPYIDATEGISHAIRLDYHSERFHLYYRLLEDMGFPKINVVLVKILKMVYTPSTTPQLRWFVDNKIVDGWDDPRLPTVRSLVRRGVKIEALKQFVYEQGVSKTGLIEWNRLWSINVDKFYELYPIHTAILAKNRILLNLKFLPGIMDKDVQQTVTLSGRSKVVTYSNKIWLENDGSSFSVGDKINLLSWGTALIDDVKTDPDGTVIGTGVLKGDSSLQPMLWLPARDELVPLLLIKFDYLIKEKEVDVARHDFEDCETCSKEELFAWGESDMRNLKQGDIRLLANKGFYRCDVPYDKCTDPIVLFHIPSRRT